ncbi:hypothetical protein ASPBRDRAFT_30022 [Aspergillus brasiliensis CBS 101740]|uniref:Uncharacterized protein n=1 Tax=Aspergillus brasiliensis (strain CBS 101740 / IMI 381727 / IBT 21946) TaxID=767769 RepID=A0A1L9UJ24_ASPBC|nr:hypothetical protein ASPBRDRAFT_30022 [Aspergillus brasiliensis CBS 101740]
MYLVTYLCFHRTGNHRSKTSLLKMSKRRFSESISPSPEPSPASATASASASASAQVPAPKRRRMRRQRQQRQNRQYLSIDPPPPEDYYYQSSSPISATTTTPVVSSPIPPPPLSSPPPPPPLPTPPPPQQPPSPAAPPLPPRRNPRYRRILPKQTATPSTSTSTSATTTNHTTHPPEPTPRPPKKGSKIHPYLHRILNHLRTPLHALVSSTTGHEHPDFPRSLLQYNLLTSEQLDRLAVHFHQVHPPVRGTFWYPVLIVPWLKRDHGTYVNRVVDGKEEVGLEVKRRRFGRFIGLRGCEESSSSGNERRRRGRRRARARAREREREREEMVNGGRGEVEEGEVREEYEEEETAEEMVARMEREWFEAMMRARYEGEYAMRWKMGRG